jgi:hypothetical protein
MIYRDYLIILNKRGMVKWIEAGKKNPKFSISILNYYVDEYNIQKTNNLVEGWHIGLSYILNAMHPNIWKFIRSRQNAKKLNRL